MVVVRLGKAQLGWATLPLEPWLATLRLFSLALSHVILQPEAAGWSLGCLYTFPL